MRCLSSMRFIGLCHRRRYQYGAQYLCRCSRLRTCGLLPHRNLRFANITKTRPRSVRPLNWLNNGPFTPVLTSAMPIPDQRR